MSCKGPEGSDGVIDNDGEVRRVWEELLVGFRYWSANGEDFE
jgi:hypothetical protein